MNSHVHRFYRKFADEQAPIRLYHEVIVLHEAPQMAWEDLFKKAPSLPRGWYELSRLSSNDRIEFVRDYWLFTLPFLPHVHAFLQKFFSQLDDIGIYLTQLRFDSPFECEIVYSLNDGSCFYHGTPPCSQEGIKRLEVEFEEVLPEDFLAFLRIHDGFSKHSDTGIIKSRYLSIVRKQLQAELEQFHREITWQGKSVDPVDLIPFYESFGQPSYQCFFALWAPSEQAGNVYCSPMERIFSDVRDRHHWQENLAFPTFLDWLIFYLESIA
jgi:hypothetical protein